MVSINLLPNQGNVQVPGSSQPSRQGILGRVTGSFIRMLGPKVSERASTSSGISHPLRNLRVSPVAPQVERGASASSASLTSSSIISNVRNAIDKLGQQITDLTASVQRGVRTRLPFLNVTLNRNANGDPNKVTQLDNGLIGCWVEDQNHRIWAGWDIVDSLNAINISTEERTRFEQLAGNYCNAIEQENPELAIPQKPGFNRGTVNFSTPDGLFYLDRYLGLWSNNTSTLATSLDGSLKRTSDYRLTVEGLLGLLSQGVPPDLTNAITTYLKTQFNVDANNYLSINNWYSTTNMNTFGSGAILWDALTRLPQSVTLGQIIRSYTSAITNNTLTPTISLTGVSSPVRVDQTGGVAQIRQYCYGNKLMIRDRLATVQQAYDRGDQMITLPGEFTQDGIPIVQGRGQIQGWITRQSNLLAGYDVLYNFIENGFAQNIPSDQTERARRILPLYDQLITRSQTQFSTYVLKYTNPPFLPTDPPNPELSFAMAGPEGAGYLRNYIQDTLHPPPVENSQEMKTTMVAVRDLLTQWLPAFLGYCWDTGRNQPRTRNVQVPFTAAADGSLKVIFKPIADPQKQRAQDLSDWAYVQKTWKPAMQAMTEASQLILDQLNKTPASYQEANVLREITEAFWRTLSTGRTTITLPTGSSLPVAFRNIDFSTQSGLAKLRWYFYGSQVPADMTSALYTVIWRNDNIRNYFNQLYYGPYISTRNEEYFEPVKQRMSNFLKAGNMIFDAIKAAQPGSGRDRLMQLIQNYQQTISGNSTARTSVTINLANHSEAERVNNSLVALGLPKLTVQFDGLMTVTLIATGVLTRLERAAIFDSLPGHDEIPSFDFRIIDTLYQGSQTMTKLPNGNSVDFGTEQGLQALQGFINPVPVRRR